MTDLQAAINKALGSDIREDESYFQFFSRLNLEGRIDMRSMIFCIAAILDEMNKKPGPMPAWNMDFISDKPPKEPKTKLKGKKA
jgi:hypothetical protein